MKPQKLTVAVSFAAFAASIVFPVGTATADEQAISCVEEGNVWVLVETDDEVSGSCATDFATGLEALESAGFEVVTDANGFVTTINGAPTEPGDEDWWGYWHNLPTDEGFEGWAFSSVGPGESTPVAGSVEGWRIWHSFTEDAEAPTEDPVATSDTTTSEATASESSDAPTEPETSDEATESSEDSSPNIWTWIGLGVVGVAAVVAVVVLTARKRKDDA